MNASLVDSSDERQFLLSCGVSEFEIHLFGLFPIRAQRYEVKKKKPGIWIIQWLDETKGLVKRRDRVVRVYGPPEPIEVAIVKVISILQGNVKILVSTKGFHPSYAQEFWTLFEAGIVPLIAPQRSPLENISKVRELANKAYNNEDLDNMCFDHFRTVYDKFSSGMTKTQKIQILVDYCDRHGEVDKLVSQVKKDNPYQYTQIFGEKSG